MITKNTIARATLLLAFLFQSTFSNSQCCTYNLSMHDSYGDGWNGGYLEVYINNVLTGTFSGTGHASIDTFTVCTGDTLRLNYSAGSYEAENTYTLFDAAWNALFSDGPTPQTGNVFSINGDCTTPVIPGSFPCTAIPIDTGQCIVSDNIGANNTGLNPGCANYQGPDVWFSMIVPPSGNFSVETDSGSLNDTGLAIWVDSLCTNLHVIACDDDAGADYFSYLDVYDLTPGQTIYIQVFGYGGGTGTFRVCTHGLEKIRVDSSELPIVIINTLNQTIVQDTKINCLMDIKYNGPGTITHLTDSSIEYQGNIGIEIRGASSSGYPQHPYGLETRIDSVTNNNVPLLGMPVENDWVLISNYNDRSLIRNTLADKLFADMGNYSVRSRLVEVLVDSSYQGIYVFGEKIKRSRNRVDIAKLTTSDSTGDQLTGGYILQQNYWDLSNSFQSNYSPIDHPGFDVHFVYEYPAADSMLPVQKAYIASYVDSLEDALYSPNFADTATGYRKYMDVKSFIDYFILNEVSRNADGFKKSVFFHKDRDSLGGKLKAGPVWDFDWAWKNIAGCYVCDQIDGSGWTHHINDCVTDNYSTGWYIRLLQDSTFNNELRCTYETYRHTILDTNYIFAYIDSVRGVVHNAQARHFQKWRLLGSSGPAPEVLPCATTYDAELDTLKAWINIRLQWLDANIPGLCAPIINGVEQQTSLNDLRYFPNPGTGNFHFIGNIESASSLKMKVYDSTGKLIDDISLGSGALNFHYKMENKGVYYFTLGDVNGVIRYGKLIVL
ncbi:MAG: CotH kinase family protein [Bacteroidetes bacterium]|nr:CotH kinase family protein [Bacteroidota bacterium]